MYKAKPLGDTVADAANAILRNETIIAPLEYLSSSWRSLEMSLINFKVELKLKWTKHFVLTVLGNEKDNAYLDSIIFTIKEAKLYVPVTPLSAKENQELSKLFSKGFESSVYWN